MSYSSYSHGQNLSDPLRKNARMKSEKKYCPVTLEPELEEIAALWPPARRFENARKLRRWARQLEVSGMVMINAGRASVRRRGVPVLPHRKAVLN